MTIEPINVTTTKQDNPLAKLAQMEQDISVKEIPVYYAPIQLSTKGKEGAPAVFHIRNFSMKDVMELALTDEADLPERLLTILQNLIFEKDVSVSNFREEEVIETIVRMYIAFFSPSIEMDFPVEDSDFEYLRRKNTKEALEQVEALQNGTWKPKVLINLVNDLEVYELPENFSAIATIKNKKIDFSVSFRAPRYGDVIIVKKWLKETFEPQEKKFTQIKALIDMRDTIKQKYLSGELVSLQSMPEVPEDQEETYKQFQMEKTLALIDVIRALHLVTFNGVDVRDKSLTERITLIQDPRIDINITKKLDAYFDSLKIGIKPEVSVINPITGEPCIRRFSFRLVDILQAIQLSNNNEYDFILGNEH